MCAVVRSSARQFTESHVNLLLEAEAKDVKRGECKAKVEAQVHLHCISPS